MMMFRFLFLALSVISTAAFLPLKSTTALVRNQVSLSSRSSMLMMSDNDTKDSTTPKTEDKKKDAEFEGPPIYEPEGFPIHCLAALAYVVPIVDASDLGKYMFEAYPSVGDAYTTLFGTVAGIYNGVPFLPFAVFFLMSYISRAPTFPVEVRFHFSQALIMSLLQFPASFVFPFLEKAGVPLMAVPFNTVFLWSIFSSLLMQAQLLIPINGENRNAYVLNVSRWAMRYMNYRKGMVPKIKKDKQ